MASPDDDTTHRGIGAFTRRVRTAVGLADNSTPSAAVAGAAAASPGSELPQRYLLKEDRDGPYLACVDISNIRVRIDRGSTVSASAARKASSGTIFIDGAAQGEPFIDASKRVYNFDHHEGCVRSFTLASCEQMMVMILKGLDLPGEQWTVKANDPDLDTVLAIWLVLNHRHVASKEDLRRRLMPLVRLQGVIDGLGLDLAELTGFPDELQEATMAIIRALRADEVELKREGSWDDVDFLAYTASALRRIDELFFTSDDLETGLDIEELSRAWIGPQRVAIGCRSTAGIYEVEASLKEVHGDRLGLIALAKNDNHFTLRQSDPFLGATLESVYPRLNLFDPNARVDQRWGGSEDIGGSPRATGTALSVDQIMAISRWVYDPPGVGRRIATILAAALGATGVLAAALVASGTSGVGGFSTSRAPGFAIGGLVTLGLALLLTLIGGSQHWAHPGLRRPRRWSPLLLLPLTVAAAFAGGAWAPLQLAFTGMAIDGGDWLLPLGTVAAVAGFELLFRGLCQGMMTKAYPVMLWAGRRFLSIPNLVAALLSTSAIVLLMLPPFWLGGGLGGILGWMAATLAMGLACGVARERSGSVWTAVILHLVSATVAWFLLPTLLAS